MDPTVADLRLSSFDLGPLEIELVAHGDGAFYRRRIDTRTGPSNKTTDRTLTGVHSHVMIPPAHVPPLASAVIHAEAGFTKHIDVAAYARAALFVGN